MRMRPSSTEELETLLQHLGSDFVSWRGRENEKKSICKCKTCHRYEGLSYKSKPIAAPFTHVGLDFAGPLFVTEGISERGNESNKVYVCLCTCASIPVVHLELTKGLGVQAFLLAFRTFTTRRGLPATLNIANAKTFKSSCKEIRRITRIEEVWRSLTNRLGGRSGIMNNE